MRMYRYIGWIYLKFFFIITFSLSFLFAGLDYLQNSGRLQGANIKVLYLFYKGSYALDLLFPLTLVFAMIVTKTTLIRSNALLSFYALGFSKKQALLPFVALSFFLTVGYVGLHLTDFVNADRKANDLLKGKKNSDIRKDLFVKYNDSFIYIGILVPEKQEAKNIRIYRMQKSRLTTIVYGSSGRFKGDRWEIPNAKIVTMPSSNRLGSAGFNVKDQKSYETLHGFKPKILTSVFEGYHAYTIQAAYEAFWLLLAQKLDTQKVRNLFYQMVVTPFFALFLVVIFFFSIPPYARSVNLFLSAIKATGATLFVWGILYLLFRIGRNGVIMPEFGSVVMVACLGIAALLQFFRRAEHI